MKSLKHLNKYFLKYKTKLLLGIVITIIARVFSLIMPPMVNKSVKAVEVFLSSPDATTADIKSTLLNYILIIIGAALLSGFFTFLMRQTIINVSRYIEADLKDEVFKQYQKLHLSFYKNNRTGDLMNRISEDVSQVRMYVGPALMYGIQTITLFVCLIPLMFLKEPTLATYTLLPLPILSVLIYKISQIIHKKSTVVQEFLSKLSTFTQESFSGISVIKAYGIEQNVNEELSLLAEEGKTKSIDLAKVQAWFFPLMLLLIGISNLFVIFIGGKRYIEGEIESVGLILEFIIYVNMLTWPVAIVGWLSSIVQRAEASQKRINEFLSVVPDILDKEGAIEKDLEGEIVFDKVSFTYPDTGIKALDEVSFTISKGQTITVLGKTGAGKSTLIDLISRMYDVDSGVITIDGEPIQNIALDSLRKAMGVVPQEAFLFSNSIAFNIGFGTKQATQEAIETVAKKAAVHQNIIEFNKGYDTILGERGITLSGGQKQRVSIARALIKDPKIFLFDDCLSAVDTETEEIILKNIKESSKDKTTLIVSHRVSSALNADKIIVMSEGKIEQQGTHNELLAKEGYYKSLYEAQSSSKEN